MEERLTEPVLIKYKSRPFTELDFASRDGHYKEFFQKSPPESPETVPNLVTVQPATDSDLPEIKEERLVYKSHPFTELDFENPNGVYKEFFVKSVKSSKARSSSSSSTSEMDMSRKRKFKINRNTALITCDSEVDVVPRKRKFVIRKSV